MKVKRVFARLLLSVVGGAAITLSLAVTGGVLSTYTANPRAQELLALPVRWPRYVYVFLSPARPRPSLIFDDTASLVALLSADVALYGLLTYFALAMLSAFRKREVRYDAPPAPGG
jgi:hypothetical protein